MGADHVLAGVSGARATPSLPGGRAARVSFPTDRATLGLMALPAMPPPGCDELSAAEKIDHVQALWDRVTTDPEAVPVTDWQREIVAERLAAHRAGQGSSRPWEDVRQDLLARLRGVRG